MIWNKGQLNWVANFIWGIAEMFSGTFRSVGSTGPAF